MRLKVCGQVVPWSEESVVNVIREFLLYPRLSFTRLTGHVCCAYRVYGPLVVHMRFILDVCLYLKYRAHTIAALEVIPIQ